MMGEWTTKCGSCKKMKPESDYGNIDYGWGTYRKDGWCKPCREKMWEFRKESNDRIRKMWAENDAKREAAGIPKIKGWNEVGAVSVLQPDGSLKVKCEGFVQTEEWVKKENKKLAFFGWPEK